MIHNKKSFVNVYNIAVIASAIMIIGGLVAVPAFISGHEAQAAFPKDIKSKVTDFLKKLRDRLTNRGGGSGGTGGGGCQVC
jgi:hypothetical protein